MPSLLSTAAALLMAGALIVPALAPEAAIAQGMPMEKPRTITMTATGTISARPDEAEMRIGVATNAATAKAALAQNSADMRPVIESLKAAGIAEKDIATSAFNVQAVYDYSSTGKPPRLTGYRVTNLVTARLRDIGKIGEVLDAAVSQGSNQISGLDFIVSKAGELKDEARKVAVASATRMAKAYAEAAGVTLGEVLSIEEASQGGYVPKVMVARAAAPTAGGPPPIEAGEQDLSVQATIVWAIK